MGQQSNSMNSAVGKSARSSSGYHQKALAEIRNSLLPFANENGSSAASTISSLSTTSGVSSASGLSGVSGSSSSERGGPNGLDKDTSGQKIVFQRLLAMGYDEETALRAIRLSGGRSLEAAVECIHKHHSMDGQKEPMNGMAKPNSGLSVLPTKIIRKPSFDRDLNRGSPALDSSTASTRSDSPGLGLGGYPLPVGGPVVPQNSNNGDLPHVQVSRQYSPNFSEPPPPPPPRVAQGPPPPPTPPRGTTPPPPMMQMDYRPPPPPHPSHYLPNNVQHLLKRMSPVPTGGTRVSVSQSSTPQRGASPVALTGGSRQPIVVQNSPQLQQQVSQQMMMYQNGGDRTAPSPLPPVVVDAPPSYSSKMAPPPYPRQSPQPAYSSAVSPSCLSTASSSSSAGSGGAVSIARPTPLPAWGARQTKTQPPIIMQSVKSTQVQKPVLQTAIAPQAPTAVSTYSKPPPPPPPYVHKTTVPPVPTTEPPSYTSSIQALAAQRALPPPPPYGATTTTECRKAPIPHPPLQRKHSPDDDSSQPSNTGVPRGLPPHPPPAPYKMTHQSPIPERRHMSKEKEEERRESKVRNYSPQAFKFFMEQHVENVIKSHQQRQHRKMQLEMEMAKISLSEEAQCQMRKMLSQKESNYIRLKRAKMDKSMFTKIKAIGVGAFGEVALVRKIDANQLYAMKTLRKADVLKRNQVAHVKAERDILAEADNEWVVKLYYSFQDKDNLYFVMDYIPGGDLMSLLIKLGIFEEKLARFYIAELTCAVESVHKMGFIHRDIKPDNILIDRDGHIKLTDFGLCTGFRWTHNSKYYQRNGEHGRQDSMDPGEEWGGGGGGGGGECRNECRCKANNGNGQPMKPLERRRRWEHQRCLAHSLVGTPNYIAPEVLMRTGYTQLCDWWSVGVILYEMLLGSPPFLANTPAETQYKVINWESTLVIPREARLSPESKDLILKLCTSSEVRLGKNGASEVKSHPFFSSHPGPVDFEAGLRRQTAPYVPKIHHATDTSNFDPVDPERLYESGGGGGGGGGGSGDSGRSDGSLDGGKQPFHGFFEFTFRRFFDDGGPAYPGRISLEDRGGGGGSGDGGGTGGGSGAEAGQSPVYV